MKPSPPHRTKASSPVPEDPATRSAAPPDKGFPVAGIGASAGGLEAFEKLFSSMPDDLGMAFVVVAHLDPSHPSMLTELLTKYTKMPVFEALDGMPVEPGCVYVIPHNKDMAIRGRTLILTKPEAPRGVRMPIDFFLRSLALDQGENAISIILSGTGSDGTLGVRAVNEVGGITIAQEPSDARYEGMPRSAVGTGLVDAVVPVEEIPRYLKACAQRLFPDGIAPQRVERAPSAVQRVLMLIRSRTGHDFTHYKKSTIHRRIEKRLSILGLRDVSAYARYLDEHTEEIHHLFKELLISVTSFFRDPEAFDALRRRVLPRILGGKPDNTQVRVWVPGCATGEEVYSIAMVLWEYMDDAGKNFKVQIFGTDIDEEAINVARAGSYTENIAIDVSPDRLRRFFLRDDAGFRIKKEIRESVVFAVQDLIKDAPFTRMDLISCRNLLIYLDADLQNRLIPLFHYSLRNEGVLFLGTSESIGSWTDIFGVFDKKWKYFQRKGILTHGAAQTFDVLPWSGTAYKPPDGEKRGQRVSIEEIAERSLLDTFAPPCAIINPLGEIQFIHGRTGKYLEPAPGQAQMNIFEMARDGVRFELRSAVHLASTQNREISHRNLRVRTNGDFQAVNLTVKPMSEPEEMRGFLVAVFEDVLFEKVAPAKSRKRDREANQCNTLEKELAHTRETLQAAIEELQASNEELRSTNEELQSTNEELQSTNEELETSKEELQSVNEELVTVNSELNAKIDQLSRAETDMKNLLDSIEIGAIFLDNDLRLKRFNKEAVKAVNLIPSDVGRPIGHIVSNLHYDALLSDALKVLRTGEALQIEVQAKDEKWYLMQIRPYTSSESIVEGLVITFTDISHWKGGAAEEAP